MVLTIYLNLNIVDLVSQKCASYQSRSTKPSINHSNLLNREFTNIYHRKFYFILFKHKRRRTYDSISYFTYRAISCFYPGSPFRSRIFRSQKSKYITPRLLHNTINLRVCYICTERILISLTAVNIIRFNI